MRKNAALTFLLVIAFPGLTGISGCKTEKPRLDQVGSDTITANSATATRASAPDISTWKISSRGLGPLHAGMPLAEVESLVPKLSAASDVATSGCTYGRSPELPVGTVLMFAKGSLARVDILSGRVQSDLGARIGDTEDQLKLLYGKMVRTTPHKYTEGHYMTVLDESDSTSRIIFETDGYRVIRFRSGRMPEVEFVEGCG